ncbi:MAG: Crp/Fnr family transcriptional regulator [Candidatus Eisenbacteria bacterium]|uniref:Crp/Fnr family transcriptional regulator n=1 Tax=Eiseniibacteriota bacterium TaxID=2212470 RepID=A0A933SDI4_UNCEI|nr:Crp/Fnr family transcriptional regulator [Candidatus Eisenbacteria bacterium]
MPRPARPARSSRPPTAASGSDLGSRLAEGVGTRRSTHVFRAGQALFYEGAPAHALFVLRTGRVKVFRTARGGEVQVLRLLGPGEVLGYRPLFAQEPYGATAEALMDSDACILPAAEVLALLRRTPSLALEMLAKLATELRLSEELLMDLAHRPVRQRVARVILELVGDGVGAAAAGAPGRIEAHELRRQDLARMAGTTPETRSRVLRAFAASGLLAVTRERIEVRDAARLARAASLPHGA